MARPKKEESTTIKGMTNLNAILKEVRKDFGEDSVMTFDPANVRAIPRVSSGILPVDIATGGGLPKGRIIEIYGPESAGKTTVALKAIAAAQEEAKAEAEAKGLNEVESFCAFIDAEHALDPIYAQNLGVDLNTCLVSQPSSGEQALDIVSKLISTGGFKLIVVDSVAALVPKAEIDGEMGEAHVGLHARLMSQAMRKLTSLVAKTETVIIFINQIREKVGVVYGNPEVTTGGRALKFYSSIRIEVRREKTLTEGTESVANRTKIKVVKNKTYPPFKTASFDIVFGKGPDEAGYIIEKSTDLGLITKGGSWYTFKGMRVQGEKKLKDYFETDEGRIEYEKLKEHVLKAYTGAKAGEIEEDTEIDPEEGIDPLAS